MDGGAHLMQMAILHLGVVRVARQVPFFRLMLFYPCAAESVGTLIVGRYFLLSNTHKTSVQVCLL